LGLTKANIRLPARGKVDNENLDFEKRSLENLRQIRFLNSLNILDLI